MDKERESYIHRDMLKDSYTQGISKKYNTFDHEYLKVCLTKLIVLLVCYLVLPYNSLEPNFSFL